MSKKEKIKPLGNRVLIRPLTDKESDSKTPSGIIMPDTFAEKESRQGVVISKGLGSFVNGQNTPIMVDAGDRVVFAPYGFDTIEHSGEEYYLVPDTIIFAIIS